MVINKHGSFYLRNGWGTKIIQAIDEDDMIFTPSNELKAVDNIGLGRVMIKALRYWAEATEIVFENKVQGGIQAQKTELFKLIDAKDRYFQRLGSLLLLHRNLARNDENATAWYWAFNEFEKTTFTKEEFVEHCQKELAERYQFAKVRDICIGGKERYDSVYQGLSAIGAEGENDIVLIHDGARPFVTAEMISASIACARECGACTVGVPAKDTIKIVDTDHYGVETPERKFVYQIQTPQTFQVPLLRRAYETMYEAKRNGDTHNITDDTMLVEQYAGVRCKVVEGAYENIKITTPEDLAIAEIFVEKTLKKF